MVFCTKQEEIYQESQRSDVATGNAGWPSQTQTQMQTQRCGALSRDQQNNDCHISFEFYPTEIPLHWHCPGRIVKCLSCCGLRTLKRPTHAVISKDFMHRRLEILQAPTIVCCGAIIWSKFGPLRGYCLVQVLIIFISNTACQKHYKIGVQHFLFEKSGAHKIQGLLSGPCLHFFKRT